MGNFY